MRFTEVQQGAGDKVLGFRVSPLAGGAAGAFAGAAGAGGGAWAGAGV